MLRNLDFKLNKEYKTLQEFLNGQLITFFKQKSQAYISFKQELQQDKDFKGVKDKATSESKLVVFENLAYIIETKHQLLAKKNELKSIIYPLINRAITNGNLRDTVNNILKLDDEYLHKFNELIEKSDLESIIDFSDKVSRKQQQLDFIERITYSEIAKNVLERKELHKYLEKMLWIFGEQYDNDTKLLSDKNLENNLKKLRDVHLKFEADTKEDNQVDVEEEVKSITDLFLYTEKPIDEERREVLIVELKAPKVKISSKELSQVKRYAVQIQESAHFSHKISYKILLISSSINRMAQIELKGTAKDKPNNPYYFWSNEDGNITIEVIKWADILESSKRKLGYLSNKLKVKDHSIQETLQSEFSDIESVKLKSTLVKSSNKRL